MARAKKCDKCGKLYEHYDGSKEFKNTEKANATVIACNSHTYKNDLRQLLKVSNVVVSATGHKNTIGLDMVNNDKLLIVDVGINRDENGKLCGDCDKRLYQTHDLITPVPAGVGLVTRAMLMKNCVDYIENANNTKRIEK